MNTAAVSHSAIPGLAMPLNQQASEAFSASFSDVLSNIQAQAMSAESVPVLDASNAPLSNQFQSGISFLRTTPSDSFGDSNEASTDQDSKSEQTQSASRATLANSSPQPDQEDSYVSSRAAQPETSHRSPDTAEPPAQQVSSAYSADSKPVEKLKHQKEQTAQSASTVLPTGGGIVAGPTVPVVHLDAASNPGLGGVSVPQGAEAINAPTAKKSGTNGQAAIGDLAFALKVQGSNGPRPTDLPLQENPSGEQIDPDNLDVTASPQTLAAPLSGVTSAGIAKFTANSDNSHAGTPGLSVLHVGSTGTYQTSDTESESTSAADEVAPATVEEPPIPNGQPIKAVQVQITGESDQRVDLKLMEKSGVLTMSVRSADRTLTKALQQNLPELTGKMNDQQIRAEWWQPSASGIAKSGNPSQNSNDSGSSNQGNPNANPNHNGSGQQGKRGTTQPDWLEELSSPQKSTQNGTQYSWHL